MTFAAAIILPVPVAPSRTWWFRPLRRPSVSFSIAWGWSPVGSNGATKRKSGTSEVYQVDRKPNRRSASAVRSPDRWRCVLVPPAHICSEPRLGRLAKPKDHARREACRSLMEMEYKDTSRRGRIIIILGIVLALIAGGTSFYLINQAQQNAGQGELQKVTIVVAAKPIAP